jgi:hypothetical protein
LVSPARFLQTADPSKSTASYYASINAASNFDSRLTGQPGRKAAQSLFCSLPFFALFSVTHFYFTKKKLSPHPLHKLARLVRKFSIFLLTKIAKCLTDME